MITFGLRTWTLIAATGLLVACGNSAPPPTGLAPRELTLDVSGAGENPLLLNETVTIYGIVRQNTNGCIPLTNKRVEFGTTEPNIASVVQLSDSSARLTARALGGTRIVAFIAARRDISLIVPIVVLEESGEPIEDDGVNVE